MVAMSGTHRRPHIIVVIGGDAHALRALDQERGVTDEGDAHLIGIERGDLESGGRDERPIAGDQAGTILPHLRGRRRFRLRLRRLRRSLPGRRAGGERGSENAVRLIQKPERAAGSIAVSSQQRPARHGRPQICTEAGARLWPAPGVLRNANSRLLTLFSVRR